MKTPAAARITATISQTAQPKPRRGAGAPAVRAGSWLGGTGVVAGALRASCAAFFSTPGFCGGGVVVRSPVADSALAFSAACTAVAAAVRETAAAARLAATLASLAFSGGAADCFCSPLGAGFGPAAAGGALATAGEAGGVAAGGVGEAGATLSGALDFFGAAGTSVDFGGTVGATR